MSKVTQFCKDYKSNVDILVNKRKWEKLGVVISAAVRNEQTVPLSVLGKNRFLSEVEQEDKDKLHFNNNKISTHEAQAVADLILFGLEFYGKPVFDYHSVTSDRYEDVDFWRNVLKFGRITTDDAGEKRISTLRSISETELGTWDPNLQHLDAATKRLSSSFTISIVNDGHVKDINLSIDHSTTNSGEPWYTRKSQLIDGVSVRKLIASEGKSLSFEEVAHLPAFLGARNQQAKWVVDGEDAESFLVNISSLDRDSIIQKLCEKVTFNSKARVISAAPSIASYQAAPLVYYFNLNQVTNKHVSPMRFLGGPLEIKETLKQMHEFKAYFFSKHGIRIEAFNADAKGYDTTIRPYHGDVVYDSLEKHLPRSKDKTQLLYIIGTSLVRPLFYTDKPLSNFSKTVVKNNLRVNTDVYLHSGEPDTNMFGSVNMFLTTYASRRESNDKFELIVDESVKRGFMPLQVIGDDNLTFYEIGRDNTIKEDLAKTTESQMKRYGLNYHEADIKGELGLYLAQYRYTEDGRFITPLSRLKLYWSETSSKALPTYLESLKLWQLFEFRWECKGTFEFIKRFIMPFDKTKMGMIDVENGQLLTVEQFVGKLKQAEEKEGKTIGQMLYTGNPTDSLSIHSAEDGISDWIREQYDKVKSAYDYYIKHK